MIKQYGRNLFLPEGDDFSKQEFDRHQEEMNLQGQRLLDSLRESGRMSEQRGSQKMQQKPKAKPTAEKGKNDSEEKLSYKEMLKRAAARK